MSNEDLSELSEIIVKAYSQGLITKRGEPRNESENAWSIHKSIYFAATIVSTIGTQNILIATNSSHSHLSELFAIFLCTCRLR